MTELEKKALALYGLICESSAGRPGAGNSVEQLMHAMNLWGQRNTRFEALRRAEPQVKLVFLANSIEWLQADARPDGNLRACAAVSEGIQIALAEVAKPLPEEVVCRLLSGYRRNLASILLNLWSNSLRSKKMGDGKMLSTSRHLPFGPSSSLHSSQKCLGSLGSVRIRLQVAAR